MPGDAIAVLSALFLGTLFATGIWETLAPHRDAGPALGRRWLANFGLMILNSFATRAWVPLGALAAAGLAESRGWGLFGAWDAPVWIVWALTLGILDATSYLEHRIFHAVPWLWRLHRVHHADPDCDVTTGLRFHPLEALVSAFNRAALIAALGAPVATVFAYEVLVTTVGLVAHGNIRLPRLLDRALGQLVFTPSLHRIHHSAELPDTDRNFGIVSPLWDRLGRTFAAEASCPEEHLVFGLRELDDPRELRLDALLTQPFRSPRPTAAAHAPAPHAGVSLAGSAPSR